MSSQVIAPSPGLASSERRPGESSAVQARLGIVLVGLAALCWWSTIRASMVPSMAGFIFGWLMMMAAMMLPALVPVVSLYARAARRGTLAPVGVFLAGYFIVWGVPALPAYFAWRRLQDALMPRMDSSVISMTHDPEWLGRLVGAALVAAALYQVTPLKQACLRGCRSPISAFTTARGSLAAPSMALRAGIRNGLWCFGCCWVLMLILITVGVMQPWWMAGIAVLIFVEKALPFGPRAARPIAVLLLASGLALVVFPTHLIAMSH